MHVLLSPVEEGLNLYEVRLENVTYVNNFVVSQCPDVLAHENSRTGDQNFLKVV